MISMRLIGNTGVLANKIRELENQIEFFKHEIAYEAAAFLVLESPVDTASYMSSHHVGVSGGQPATVLTERNQPWEPFANLAIARLEAEIDALPDDSRAVVFSNASGHANKVEYELGYAPFTKMRAKLPEIVDRAAARAKAI